MEVFKLSQFPLSSCTSHSPPDHTRVAQRPTCHKCKHFIREHLEPRPLGLHASSPSLSTLVTDTGQAPVRGREMLCYSSLALCPPHKGWLHPKPPRLVGCAAADIEDGRCFGAQRGFYMCKKSLCLLFGKRKDKSVNFLKPSSTCA